MKAVIIDGVDGGDIVICTIIMQKIMITSATTQTKQHNDHRAKKCSTLCYTSNHSIHITSNFDISKPNNRSLSFTACITATKSSTRPCNVRIESAYLKNKIKPFFGNKDRNDEVIARFCTLNVAVRVELPDVQFSLLQVADVASELLLVLCNKFLKELLEQRLLLLYALRDCFRQKNAFVKYGRCRIIKGPIELLQQRHVHVC